MKFDIAVLAGVEKFQISDISCLCDQNLTIVSSFNGEILGLKWVKDKFEKIFFSRPFKTSIRKIRISASGKFIICSSSDGRLCLVRSNTGKVKFRIDNIFSSKASIGSVVSLDDEDKILAIGNDDGDVKIIDIQNLDSPLIKEFNEFKDQVSDMLYLNFRKILLCSSGDGSMMVIDLKKHKLVSLTDSFDDEITALSTIKSGSKIVCSTGLGFLNIFDYNYWGVVQDRLPQHPDTINCIVSDSFESNILYTGCSDGIIRTLIIHPNSIKGEICQLDDSVEKLQILSTTEDGNCYKYLLASTCSDSTLHLVDLSINKNENESVKMNGKRKIAEFDKQRDTKKSFFADLE